MGLPNMVNVMIEWLHAAGFRKREIQNMVEDHLKILIMKHFDPKKADLIFTEEGSVSYCCMCVLHITSLSYIMVTSYLTSSLKNMSTNT